MSIFSQTRTTSYTLSLQQDIKCKAASERYQRNYIKKNASIKTFRNSILHSFTLICKFWWRIPNNYKLYKIVAHYIYLHLGNRLIIMFLFKSFGSVKWLLCLILIVTKYRSLSNTLTDLCFCLLPLPAESGCAARLQTNKNKTDNANHCWVLSFMLLVSWGHFE